MKTKIINLYGGPGSGKSTGAAYIFSQLKMNNINCEYIQEYAKDRVWQNDLEVFNNQLYVVAKQSLRMSRLKGKVDVIITDSPLLLGIYYCKDVPYAKDFHNVLFHIYEEYENHNYFVNRVKPYNPKGRFQDEDGAKNIDTILKNILNFNFIKFKEFNGDQIGYNNIIADFISYANF